MKSGEFIPVPAERMPEFVVPHDGMQLEVPDKEQAHVSDKFSSLIDDTLLAHIQDVTITSAGEARLLVGSFHKEQGIIWKLKITRSEYFEPIEGIDYADQNLAVIELSRDVNGRTRERLAYRLGADGVVRRHTVEDMQKKFKRDRAFFDLDEEERNNDQNPMSALEIFRRMRREAAANRKLEKDMGVNMQPVGYEEITGLLNFISDTGFESPRAYNSKTLAEVRE